MTLYQLQEMSRQMGLRGTYVNAGKMRAVQSFIGRLPTAAAQVRAHVRSYDISGGQNGTGAGFSEYFGFPCQFSFHRLLHIHHHLSSGAGTIGQLVADVPSGLSLTPPQETKKKTLKTTAVYSTRSCYARK
jgi:hypothetical protein